MNNKWLYSFMTVVECGSITAAAKEIFISPQALAQQMELLEDEVGTPLFQRTRKGVTLTVAGKEFLSGAQEIAAIYARTLSRCRLASKAEKTIRIPMMNSIKLPKLMEAICTQYVKSCPDKVVPEFVTDLNFGSWLDGLVNYRYDMIEHYALDRICPVGIHFEELSTVTSYCVVSQVHPLAGESLLKPENLDGYRIIVPPENIKLCRYLLLYIEARGIHVEVAETKNDRYEILQEINNGGIYMADEEIGKMFFECTSIPLDFDTHIQHGLACREEMRENYGAFFEIAHKIAGSAHDESGSAEDILQTAAP